MSELVYVPVGDRFRNEENDITIKKMDCCNKWIVRHGAVKHRAASYDDARTWAAASVDSQRPSVA